MNNFTLDIEAVEAEPLDIAISTEELEEATKGYRQVKAKLAADEEMTLEDQRLVILYCRADRTNKFVLNKAVAKPAREARGKKVSRAILIEFMKKDKVQLSEQELLNRDHSLAIYKGKHINKKELHELMIKKEQTDLTTIEERDVIKTLFGEWNEENLKLLKTL